MENLLESITLLLLLIYLKYLKIRLDKQEKRIDELTKGEKLSIKEKLEMISDDGDLFPELTAEEKAENKRLAKYFNEAE